LPLSISQTTLANAGARKTEEKDQQTEAPPYLADEAQLTAEAGKSLYVCRQKAGANGRVLANLSHYVCQPS